MLDERTFLEEGKLSPHQKEVLKQLWQPAISKEEVFFTTKENIEGFATLLAHFLPQMISPEVESPSLVNVDNHDETS